MAATKHQQCEREQLPLSPGMCLPQLHLMCATPSPKHSSPPSLPPPCCPLQRARPTRPACGRGGNHERCSRTAAGLPCALASRPTNSRYPVRRHRQRCRRHRRRDLAAPRPPTPCHRQRLRSLRRSPAQSRCLLLLRCRRRCQRGRHRTRWWCCGWRSSQCPAPRPVPEADRKHQTFVTHS